MTKDSTGLNFGRLGKDLEEYAQQKDIDLDAMLKSASVHFTSPVFKPRIDPLTPREMELLIEDDELALNPDSL